MIKQLINKYKYRHQYKRVGISKFAEVSINSIDSRVTAYIGNFVVLVGNTLILKGKNNILDRCTIDARNISLGWNTSLQLGSFLIGDIRIGNDVIIGPSFYASSYTHDFKTNPAIPIRVQDQLNEKNGTAVSKPIFIEDDCWIGMNSFIAPGITLAKGCIVAFGSAVNKEFPPYSIIAGSPAKLVGQRFLYNPPARISAGNACDYPYFYSGFTVIDNKVATVDTDLRIHLDLTHRQFLHLQFSRAKGPIKLKVANTLFEIKDEESLLTIEIKNLIGFNPAAPVAITIQSGTSDIRLEEAWGE